MNAWWITSLVILWVLVCIIAVVEVVMLRQMGLLYLRLGGNLGALQSSSGPQLGQELPLAEVYDRTGILRSLIPITGQQKLLLFMSPTCQLCDALIPDLPAFARSIRVGAELLVVLNGADRTGKLRDWKPGRPPVVVDASLMDIFDVPSLPYAIAVDDLGRVASKGLVNDLVQLESLLNTPEDQGAPSLSPIVNGDGQGVPLAIE